MKHIRDEVKQFFPETGLYFQHIRQVSIKNDTNTSVAVPVTMPNIDIVRPAMIGLLHALTSTFDHYGIRYVLVSGSLIGYTRLKDFLPW